MLHGKILRSPHPHARIRAIDTSRAEALPGVHAVVTGADMPVTYCVIPWTRDEYPLCVDRVRYMGDGVAAVAAVDEDTATGCAGPHPGGLRAPPARARSARSREARRRPDPRGQEGGAERQRHEARAPGLRGGGRRAGGQRGPGRGGLLLRGHHPRPHRAPLRHRLAWTPTGKLTVWSSTQVPHYLHRELARVLDLDVAAHPRGAAGGGRRVRRQVGALRPGVLRRRSWRRSPADR